ncbi:hypothetical protein N9L06_03200 [Mariniblastus sp.]|nr:hypothetical protein [Mariniblastus sp.]
MKKHSPIVYLIVSALVCVVAVRIAGSHAFAPLDQQTVVEAKVQVENQLLHVHYNANQEAAYPKLPIRNLGGKRLIVRTREASCDCFLREASLVIAPGETKNLPLTLPMHALAYASQFNLMLVTNDPQQPNIPVTIIVEDSLASLSARAVSVLDPAETKTPSQVQ